MDQALAGCARDVAACAATASRHTLPGALRTKALLETAFTEPLTLSRIAVFVGCSRTTLIDQFTAAFGLRPAEYLARVRMREGLRRLRALSDTIENAAAEVGYRSGNKFYARMRRSPMSHLQR